MTVRLLLADDEDLVRRGLAALIEREARDIEVVGAAADGVEALEMAQNLAPDVVVTDIRMPGLNGLDLITQLRADCPDLRAVILSGYSEFDYARKAIGLGVAEYLLKPVDPTDLLATLARMREEIAAERAERAARATTLHGAAEHVLHALIEGLPVAQQATAACLPAAAGWALVLLRPTGPMAGSSDLAEVCRAASGPATVVEDAYGYQCVLLPLPRAAPDEVAAAARRMRAALATVGRTATILAARPCADLASIGAAHAEAVQVAEYSAAFEGTAPVLAWEVLPAAERWPMLSITHRDALLDAVAGGSADGAERAARAFAAHLTRSHAPGAQWALWLEMMVLVIHHAQNLGARADALLEPGQDVRALLAQTGGAANREARLVALAQRAAAATARLRRAPQGMIGALRAYIDDHLDGDLTITTLARRAHLNPTYLGEVFKQATGEALGAYVIRMRMRGACHLLDTTDQRVYAIAQAVGYVDAKHFATMFRTLMGVTPAEYRAQQRPRRTEVMGAIEPWSL